jgi:hypothetical protein
MPLRSKTLQKRKSKSVGCFFLNYFSPGKGGTAETNWILSSHHLFLSPKWNISFSVGISLLFQCRYVTSLLIWRHTHSCICTFPTVGMIWIPGERKWSWLFNNYMKQCPTLGAISSSASQEIPCILRYPKVHWPVGKSPPLVPVLRHMDPF